MGSAAASTVTTDRAVMAQYLRIDLAEVVQLELELPEALADACAELDAIECASLAQAVRLLARRAGIVLPKGGK